MVRKMINRINTPAEAYMIVSSLSPGAVTLMMDAHGSYLAQRCLEKLSPQNKKVRIPSRRGHKILLWASTRLS